mmetsp:Transcript_9147/g.17223  ORF Transcript_9147/g.17223 Transcript_9147/m.17223 type:complete len:881 (+) Transcript_9147:381-3023(+)
MSLPETNVSSLLMQAARSAAIEDGVAIPDHAPDAGGGAPAVKERTGGEHGEKTQVKNNHHAKDAVCSLNRTASSSVSATSQQQEGAAISPAELSSINKAREQSTNIGASSATTASFPVAVAPPLSSMIKAGSTSNSAVTNAFLSSNHASRSSTSNNTTNNSNKHISSSAGTAAHLASSLSQKAAESRPVILSGTMNNKATMPVPVSTPSSGSSPSALPTVAASTVPNRMVNTDVASSTNNGSATSGGGGKKKGPPLRRGKWSAEEEAYANRLIMEFKAGLLPLTDGTTLRTFLSKLLNCDPMRISKKFVGNNCIGKQVFRRRTADINRLTPEQIQQSRTELSELERRFLDKVAQTNRMKTSGVSNTANNTEIASEAPPEITNKAKDDDMPSAQGLTPPWLRPPNGFKHGTGAATAAAHLSSGSNRAAMAGRALLQGYSSNDYAGGNHMKQQQPMNANLNKAGSAGLLALMELQQRQNGGNNLLSSVSNYSASNFLSAAAAAVAERENNSNRGDSMLDIILKSGLSRDQLNQLVNESRDTSNSLSDMLKRQSSLDALMSLDFQSFQSIDNLANLMQNGRASTTSIMGTKNWQPDSNLSANNLAARAASIGSNTNLSNLANARKLQSEGRMESLMKSLSNSNFSRGPGNPGSNANFNTLLQNMQNNLGGSTNNMLSSASAFDLANMLRADSSTGLTALRMQEGLTQRNSSVDDFLSLVASGDIPHQDPHLLNVPLQSLLQQQQQSSNNSAAAHLLAQQQILTQAANGNGNSLHRFASLNNFSTNNLNSTNNGRNSGITNSNSLNAFGDHFPSLGNLGNSNSAVSLLSHYASQQGSLGSFSQYQQHNQNQAQQQQTTSVRQENTLKRKFTSDQNPRSEGFSKR